jgi:hypothetical protein
MRRSSLRQLDNDTLITEFVSAAKALGDAQSTIGNQAEKRQNGCSQFEMKFECVAALCECC